MKEPTPTIAGPHGRAWQYDMKAFKRARRVTEGDPGVALWIIEAPWANMMWSRYALALIHLRPIPGVKTLVYLPGATHELTLFAVNDKWKLDLLDVPQYLTPANFAAQFEADSDTTAAWRIYNCVTEITEGTLSPDTDFTQHWIARFNASMIKGDPAEAGRTVLTLKTPGGDKSEMAWDPAPLGKLPDTRPWSVKKHEQPPGLAAMLGLDPSKFNGGAK